MVSIRLRHCIGACSNTLAVAMEHKELEYHRLYRLVKFRQSYNLIYLINSALWYNEPLRDIPIWCDIG